MTKYCTRSFREKELEAKVEQLLLKIVRRRMKRATIKMKEEEEVLAEAEVLAEISMQLHVIVVE